MPSRTVASFWIRSKQFVQGARFASLVLRKSLLCKLAQLVTRAGEALLPSSFVRQRCEDLCRNGILFGLRQRTNLLECLFKQGGHVSRLSLRRRAGADLELRLDAGNVFGNGYMPPHMNRHESIMPCCVHSTYAGK